MIFEKKEVALKNGTVATFKSPDVSDAEKMMNYIKKACAETDFLLRYPEEWAAVSVEAEEKWVENLRISENNLAITCLIDGAVAGNCELIFNSGMKTSHRATVAIAVLKDYWNIGIASILFEEMIKAAENRRIEIMELEFFQGNDRARHLYEKFGFRIVAEKPNAIKLKNGKYLSVFAMQKYLFR